MYRKNISLKNNPSLSHITVPQRGRVPLYPHKYNILSKNQLFKMSLIICFRYYDITVY